MPQRRPASAAPVPEAAAPLPHRADHAVIAALLRRRAAGTREDGRHIALVIEGGGMRGVVSAGMTAALEQLGLRDCFDSVHGASAGAINGAFLLAGQAAYGCALYMHGFGDPRFVSVRRALRGGAIFDMDHIVNRVWRERRPLRCEAILSSGIDLHCTATDVDSAEVVDLAQLNTPDDVRAALRASTRLPWLAGPPVSFRGRRLLDATLAESIPIGVARASATDMLVLQTRPDGVPHSAPSRALAAITERYLRGLNPRLVELHATRSARYDELVGELRSAESDPDGQPAVCVIRPAAGALVVGHLERRRRALQDGAIVGLRTMWAAVEGEDPEVMATLRAFPPLDGRGADA